MNDLLDRIRETPRLRRCLEALESAEQTTRGHDLAHGVQHSLRVAILAQRIGTKELGCDRDECIASALLHDIVNVPKNDPRRKIASELCAQEARRILTASDWDPDRVDRICVAILHHSFSRQQDHQRNSLDERGEALSSSSSSSPSSSSSLGEHHENKRSKTEDEGFSSPLAIALRDADRLEALGSIGIVRNLAVGFQMGAALCDSSDPWAAERALDDAKYSIDHYFVKLFRLKEGMMSVLGRKEAERREKVMWEFLRNLGEELGIPMSASTSIVKKDVF